MLARSLLVAPTMQFKSTRRRYIPASRFVVAVPALALLVVACQPQEEEEPEAPERYRVASPLMTTAVYEREYVGEIQATQRVELRARMKGVLESIAVDEGQQVRAGQLLFSIGARVFEQELNKARAVIASAVAELNSSQIEHASMKMLFDKNIVSKAEMALMDSKVHVLQAKLEEARASESQVAINLTYARVQAPFDGVVNRLPKKVGSTVGEDDLLTTITNTKDVFVYFRVSEQEYLEYTSRETDERPKEVSLRLPNGKLHVSSGLIDAVETEFDTDTGNIAFRARFPNEDDLLKHGSSGTVIVRTELKDGLVIPQESTFEIQDQLYVYTVDDDNMARAKRIVPKARLKDTFVVESGLGPRDRFIAEGIQKVKDGAKIAARSSDPSAQSSL